MIEIFPAVNERLLKEFRKKIKIAESLSAIVDVDISDGKFAPTKTVQLKSVAKLTKARLNVHYMGYTPEKIVCDLPDNTHQFTFHFEATKWVEVVLKECKKRNILPSIAISPDTKVSEIKQYVKSGMGVHILTVYPGSSGQKLIERCLAKIRQLKKLNKKVYVGVDGGVNPKTAKFLRLYPLDYVSVTSAILNAKNPKSAYDKLVKILNN